MPTFHTSARKEHRRKTSRNEKFYGSIYLSIIHLPSSYCLSINQSTNQKGTDKKLECLTKWGEGGEKMENGVGRSEYRIMTEEFIAAMYEHKDEAC